MNVMVDIETLGTRPGSIILSIGAVFFDDLGRMGAEFYEVISAADCAKRGMTIDPLTVKWWMEQGPDAQTLINEASSGSVHELPTVMAHFRAFLNTAKDGVEKLYVWGSGCDFDNIHLAEAFRISNMEMPWNFHYNRCFRTLKEENRDVPAPAFVGTKHNALDDARHQALWMERIRYTQREKELLLRELDYTQPPDIMGPFAYVVPGQFGWLTSSRWRFRDRATGLTMPALQDLPPVVLRATLKENGVEEQYKRFTGEDIDYAAYTEEVRVGFDTRRIQRRARGEG